MLLQPRASVKSLSRCKQNSNKLLVPTTEPTEAKETSKFLGVEKPESISNLKFFKSPISSSDAGTPNEDIQVVNSPSALGV